MLLIKIKASFESREVFMEKSQSSAFLKFKQIGSRKCFLPTGLVKISFPPPERPSFCRIPLKLGKVQISPLSSSGGFIMWWIQRGNCYLPGKRSSFKTECIWSMLYYDDTS